MFRNDRRAAEGRALMAQPDGPWYPTMTVNTDVADLDAVASTVGDLLRQFIRLNGTPFIFTIKVGDAAFLNAAKEPA